MRPEAADKQSVISEISERPMSDMRKLKRIHLSCFLNVLMEGSPEPVGQVLDIQTDGMLMMSQEPIPDGQFAKYKIELPESMNGVSEIVVEAESVWSSKDFDPGLYNTGMQFIRISDADIERIKILISDYGIDSE